MQQERNSEKIRWIQTLLITCSNGTIDWSNVFIDATQSSNNLFLKNTHLCYTVIQHRHKRENKTKGNCYLCIPLKNNIQLKKGWSCQRLTYPTLAKSWHTQWIYGPALRPGKILVNDLHFHTVIALLNSPHNLKISQDNMSLLQRSRVLHWYLGHSFYTQGNAVGDLQFTGGSVHCYFKLKTKPQSFKQISLLFNI